MRAAVRSDALLATAGRLGGLADEVRADAGRLAGALAATGAAWVAGPDVALARRWLRLQGEAVRAVGPGGLWGEAVELDALAVALRGAALVYAEVERCVSALLAGVAAAADLTAPAGWFVDAPGEPSPAAPGTAREPVLHDVSATLRGPLVGDASAPGRAGGVADLVAAGEGLGGGRVRVVETTRPDGGSAWVVVVPGTQRWSPRAGPNPFDLTTDLRALTGDPTVAAAGVAAALDRARSRSHRATPRDPVLLVGHSQGGILAAALASDPAFRHDHRVTHLVTSGAPVGLFPVPSTTRVLSVEHADDPVPRLDLGPNPAHPSWLTVVTASRTGALDARRHRLEDYVGTVRTVEAAPRGTVSGLDAWQASAGDFVGAPVRSVSEVVVERARARAQEGAGGQT